MMKQRMRRFAEAPLSPATFLPWLCLLPLAAIYGALQRLRVLLYRIGLFSSYRAPQPVISVGNLTVGGTGKTPIVDHILRYAVQYGLRPAVVSRGYGGEVRSGVTVVSRGDGHGPHLPAARCGDEPFLLARRNPQAVVVVAPRRREGIETAIRECGADLIVLDDGFQHLAVQRDLDILLLDACRPFGNGSVLPAGLLREPLSAHRRAQLCILTRDDDFSAASPLPAIATLRCRHRLATDLFALDGSVRSLDDFRGLRGIAFAGIAAPDVFFRSLQALGLHIVASIPLNDHATFDLKMLQALNSAAAYADFFVTTEKDGVKLTPSDLTLPCYQALLEVEFSPPGGLEQVLNSLLK